MSPLKRLSSLGCCEASGTPVTDCLAPEHAPALDLTGAGAHEKKRGTCRADFPRVSCPRCHGPSAPHSSTVPNNSRTFRIPPIVSTFLASCQGRASLPRFDTFLARRLPTENNGPTTTFLFLTRFCSRTSAALAKGTRMTPSRLFAHRIVDFTRQTRQQTLTRIAQISIGRPPTTTTCTTTSPPCAIPPHTTTPCYRSLAHGSDRGWVFLAFSSPSLRRQQTHTATTEGRIQTTDVYRRVGSRSWSGS